MCIERTTRPAVPGGPRSRSWPVRPGSGRRGHFSWDDLFDGNGNHRDFEEVVRRKGLTLEQLRRAGVAEGVARRSVGLGPLGK